MDFVASDNDIALQMCFGIETQLTPFWGLYGFITRQTGSEFFVKILPHSLIVDQMNTHKMYINEWFLINTDFMKLFLFLFINN